MAIEGVLRLDAYRLEIPVGYIDGMRVPGIIYVDEALEKLLEPQAIGQTANVATMPGIVAAAMAMPDIHTGYGFPIGGVAAFDIEAGGVLSPGGVGYDIN
jgi:tRNA-splicing ligase RtcB